MYLKYDIILASISAYTHICVYTHVYSYIDRNIYIYIDIYTIDLYSLGTMLLPY